ncbi:hypothetical protein QBZ16_000993 [Prototheca wickerhamii]|uniref:ABC transporter domain-containing protein n=1 Tax=Prototheca wickerhamii TaxID=3111 RepID=A0AAD9IFA1_PROWI|nr:hypothetical protein QBZ16_000993 [Prototheca wickerhamii]
MARILGVGSFTDGQSYSVGDGRQSSGLVRDSQRHHREDFEELKAAAIARLKKKRQTKRAVVFPDEEGTGLQAVDPSRLTKDFSVQLLNHYVPKGEVDAGVSLLHRVQERLERAGVPTPTVTIRYKNLSVRTSALIGGKDLPTLPHAVQHALFSFLEAKRPLSIVDDASGKTTFMKALVGRYRHLSDLKVEGEVTYNGHDFGSFVPERCASYVNQFDTHFGELTVRETMDFAVQCQSSSHWASLLETVVAREAAAGIRPDPEVEGFMKALAFGHTNSIMVEGIIRMLGLTTCSETVVGNQMLRGISGGQRKRLGTAEVAVANSLVLVADEISTGLDSATTFAITSAFRSLAHIERRTLLIALLQPAPETFELFDDVILMSDGLVGVAEIFSPFGLVCPPRKGVADFLQEATTPSDQQKYYVDNTKPYEYVTAGAIRAEYLKTPAYRQVEAELAKPYAPSPSDLALPTKKYAVPYGKLLASNWKRSMLLQTRTKLFAYMRVVQICLMGFCVATLFLNTPKDTISDGNVFSGAAFYSLIYMLIGGFAELHLLTERLPVFYKQREMMFYPGWCFALPTYLFRLPFALVDATLWSCIVYFAPSFDRSSRFFVFWLIMFIAVAWATSLFQAIAAVCRTDTISTAVSSFFMLVFIVTGGFVMIKSAIPSWWIAAYWANPWAYLTQSISVNEFLGASWDKPNPADPSNPESLGVQFLQFRDFIPETRMVWIGIGACIASIVINVAVLILATTFMPPRHSKPVMSEEALEELEYARQLEGPVPASIQHDIKLGMRRAGSEKAMHDDGLESGLGETPAAPAGGAQPSAARGALPFRPMAMTFKDIAYSVPVPKGMDISAADVPQEGEHSNALRLLSGINGVFKPGVLTALMGASGAGKTTFMDVLAGRKTGGTVTGEVHINGFPKNQATFNRVSGYVEQEDVHLPQTTVGEAIRFSAALRLPKSVSAEVRESFVAEIMNLVEMDKLDGSLVGILGESGLSIQARKRLTIAVELVANPSIIFMDEPTTGLDARAASVVMATVRSIVNTGRTVVCTIHQPSIDIFEAFDELLLLKPGGRCVFAGPIGFESKALISYFTSIEGVEPIKPGYNPANWMLEQTSPANETALGVDFSSVYAGSAYAAKLQATVDAAHEPEPGAQDIALADLEVTGAMRQSTALLHRNFTMYWRAPDYNITRFGVTLLVGFVFGSLAWKQGDETNTPTGILNVAGLIFASTLFIGVSNSMSVQPIAHDQRSVMYRERAAGMYGLLPYALAQFLVEIPYIVVQDVLYSCVVYWMVGFIADASKFFWFMFLFGLTLAYFTTFGQMSLNLMPEMPLAQLFMSFFFGFWNLMCGFLIPASSIPGWWIWYYYINPITWTLYGLIVSQLGDLNSTYVQDFAGQMVTVPQFLYDLFKYKHSMLWPSVAILIAFTVVFCTSSFLGLKLLNYQNR